MIKAILERIAIHILFFSLNFVRPQLAYTIAKALKDLAESEAK